MLDSPLWQPLSRSSFVFLLVWVPLLHTPCISSPNHHLFATHAHTPQPVLLVFVLAYCFSITKTSRLQQPERDEFSHAAQGWYDRWQWMELAGLRCSGQVKCRRHSVPSVHSSLLQRHSSRWTWRRCSKPSTEHANTAAYTDLVGHTDPGSAAQDELGEDAQNLQ